MPRVCFIPECRTHKDYYERGVTMFSFPRRNPDQLKAWNRACSRESDFQPPRYACICEKHFEADAFAARQLSGRRALSSDAVPTLFLDGWKPEADSLRLVSEQVSDTVELGLTPNLEQVLLNEPSDIAVEEEPVSADMFCRMCGIKHEKDNRHDLSELRGELENDVLFKVCLLDYEALKLAQAICSNCYSEIDSIVDFLRKCHEGQRRLLEQLSELRQMPIPEPSDDDEAEEFNQNDDESADESEEGDIAPMLSAEHDFETEEMKNARMDRYIDRLIAKYKSNRGKTRISKSWECLDCRQVFPHRTHLKKHRRTCQLVGAADSKRQGPFRCEKCDKMLNTLPGYRYHLIKMHDSKEDGDNCPEDLRLLKSNKVITCPICSDGFATVAKLRYHLPSHKSTNQGRDSEGRALVNKVSENACMCSFCGKMERSPASLEIHMKFHLKQKDWQCDQCDKQYYTKADLKSHILAIHEKVTYPCEHCGVVLKSKITFTRHKRLHDVSLQKNCGYCTKRFTTTNALNKHLLSRHQGLRRPRLHDIEESDYAIGNDDEDAFEEEIIEEVVMGDASSDFDTKDVIKQETILAIESVEEEG